MDPFTLSLFLITGLLLLYYFVWEPLNHFKRLGVEHERPLPILGNTASVTFRRITMPERIEQLYHRFSSVKYFGVYNLFTPLIMIRDPELIASITTKNFDHFVDHRGFVDGKLDPLMGSNLFALRGDDWREMRKLLSPSFTSMKMKMMFHLIRDCADSFTNFVAADAKNGKVYNQKDIFARYTIDVIATCSFGISIDSMRNPDNEFYLLSKDSLNFTTGLSWRFMLGFASPKLCTLLGIRMMSEEVHRYFLRIVGETVKTRQEQSGSSSNHGAGGINLGQMVGGRRPPSQQSFHSSKNNHSHNSRHQTPPTPRNACQLPEIAARCIHIRTSSRNRVSMRNQQSITKMLLLISTVFILLNLPSYVIRLCVFFFTLARKNTPDLLWCLQQFFMLLYYTNFSINFLLYAMCGITFRRCLQQLVRKLLKSMTRYHCNPQRYI